MACVLPMCVAQSQACHRPHRRTTGERGCAEADGLGFFVLSLAAYTAHRDPANGAGRWPVPPARAPAALRVQTARATGLEERHELALGLGIPLDVALGHGEAGMAGELLHVPETPPDLRHAARRAGDEGA